MEQKDYNLEIVNVLVKGREHIREIAKILKINHMMIVRKMNQLLDQNVVDYKIEGRNKNYFLRKTPEARAYVLMAEDYKLVRLLLKYPSLREVVFRMQGDKRIKFACIFGSYAKGFEGKRSDFDIYIESGDLKIKREYSKLDSKLGVKIGKWNKKNLLVKEIIKNHVIIKGGEVYYEKVFN